MSAAVLPPGATRGGEPGSFTAADGRVLGYRRIDAGERRPLALYLHGIESHGAWFLPAAEGLAAHGISTVLLDRRGSGLNRAVGPGDAASADLLLDDIARCREALGRPEVHLVGLSWGGKLALAQALRSAEGIRSLALLTPGLRARVDLRLRDKAAFVLGLMAGGRNRIPVPIRAEMFTRTPEFLDYIRRDPWRISQVTARFLAASFVLDRRIRRGIRGLRVPTLLVLAGQETIVDNEGVRSLLARTTAGIVRELTYPEARHSVQFDQKDRLVADLVAHMQAAEHR
jgi:alpha-beta hydrolase superfamily lysophospholipase